MNDPVPARSMDGGRDGGATFKPLYTARVSMGGGGLAHGRATGTARSSDGILRLDLRMPGELGGDSAGPNPEQLFAAGFAASLHGELSLVARQHMLDPAPITVEATVAVGRDPSAGGYRLQADLVVDWPGVSRATADRLLARAAALCPYAKMTGQGIPTTISLTS
ncbi:Ohr family peroxiredoxin [Actinocorallia populi]|uniref:Ohr family peroxiredoxin n=1 Tax=Actinocorallia populi TaxID=2079200 RepID=UPI0018E4E174|nr:Ohr family peroxiredoxin [Actinocorallia populi]